MSFLEWMPLSALVAASAIVALPRSVTTSPRLPELVGRCSRMVMAKRAHRGIKAAELRSDVTAMLRQFSALLQSGRSQRQAWLDLLDHWRQRQPDHPLTQVCVQGAASEVSGAGAAEGLRRAGSRSPHPQVQALVLRMAALTALSAQTGAALSQLVDQLAHSAEESAELEAAVDAAVAGPRLTQLVLSLLPVAGVALGHLMGAAPLQALTGGGLGLLCLVLGLGFLLAGRVWSTQLIKSVMRRA